MPEVITKTTVRLSESEVAEAIAEYVAKLQGGDLPAMKPETIKWSAFAGDPDQRYQVDRPIAEISSDD